MNKLQRATDTFKELICYYLGIVAACGIIYHFAEGKSLWDSIWWAFVTSMTVGYGDFFPVTVLGRLDAIFLMHIVPLFIIPLIIVRILTRVIKDENQFSHEEQEDVKDSLRKIKSKLGIE